MMTISGLLPLIRQTPAYTALRATLRRSPLAPNPLPLPLLRVAQPALLAALQGDLEQPILVVVDRPDVARQRYEQLLAWSSCPEQVLFYPAPESLPFERVPVDPSIVQQRIQVLARLGGLVEDASSGEKIGDRRPETGDEGRGTEDGSGPTDHGSRITSHASPLVVVTAVRGLLHQTISLRDLAAGVQHLLPGSRVRPDDLLHRWLAAGYQPAVMVSLPGTFSRRGGILDIWPPTLPLPARLEFFGDVIESIRHFDPTSQRSTDTLSSLTITPPTETPVSRIPQAAAALSELALDNLRPEMRASFRRDLERLQQGETFTGIEFYAPYFYPPGKATTLLDHFVGLVVLDDPVGLRAAAQELHAQASELRDKQVGRGDLPVGFRPAYKTWAEITPPLAAAPCLSLTWRETPDPKTSEHPPFLFRPSSLFAGRLQQALDEMITWSRAGQVVVLTTHQAQRIAAMLDERGITAVPVESLTTTPAPGSFTLIQGSLAGGWTLERPGGPPLQLLTDEELFGWLRRDLSRTARPRRLARQRRPAGPALLADLSPGDFVVHVEHGIGIYRGLIKMTLGEHQQEYLLLEYAEGDRLYVPVSQVNRVSRYVGAGGDTAPLLTRLSSSDWERARSRVKQAVQNVARDLLAIYASRATVNGHAYAPDTPWQQDLEAAFPYMETPDQLRAIEEVKADMEQVRPMDRLICGDVGYGKTEVALRATFKAVMDGKQAAILVPTTILAQQHYNTFRERLATFPIRVEMLSRFRSPREQRDVIAGLRAGQVDIVIGTHRLLQKDIAFKDLGLVVIDEEQRFGVIHKERLKQLRREVDVLTLTATPIPRTLYMSLSGVRDMSTIDTPPEDRLPILTTVHEYDDALVRSAILREMDRGGQVYFVHNRVHSIYHVADHLKALVPEATFAVGHGQMDEETLEETMLDFARGKYDVLVCTAIIESGLDIPNVNTIIIDRADRFGLAQLYQLRGRVGRGANRAYALLLHEKDYQLPEVAEARLRAIFEANELGAGYRIAMRDLEIRGAGNLLGVEQHGHIAAVGFDLYCRLLAQAVEELRAQGDEQRPPAGEWRMTNHQARPTSDVTINLPLDAYLPHDYVTDEATRLALYQRMNEAHDPADVNDLEMELKDRFGALPEPAVNLLFILRLRIAASAGQVTLINQHEDGMIHLRLADPGRINRHALIRRFGPQVRVGEEVIRFDRRKAGGGWPARLLELVQSLG